jgi:hypothetical protein
MAKKWMANDFAWWIVLFVICIAVIFAMDAMAVALLHGTKTTPGSAKPGPLSDADAAPVVAGLVVAMVGVSVFVLTLSVVFGKQPESMDRPGQRTGLTRKRLLWIFIGAGMMFTGITVARFGLHRGGKTAGLEKKI